MTFTRFWTPVRPRRKTEELPETEPAGEPETGVLSLRQLMDSLGPPNASFDPDSTAHFSVEELQLRRAELEAPAPRPPTRVEEPAPAPPTPAAPALAAIAPPPRNTLSPLTKLSLALLVPALGLLLLPRAASAPADSPSPAPVVRATPSATPTPTRALEPTEGQAPAAPLDANGKSREREAADHLAAGDLEGAWRDYEALRTRSRAHAAAALILERRLRKEARDGKTSPPR